MPGAPIDDGLLFVGRHDFAVRSLHMTTREETWNATYARLSTLTPGAGSSLRDFLEGRRGTVGSGAPRAGGMLHPAAAAGAVPGAAALPRLLVGSDNSLQAFEGNGFLMWKVPFPTPPVAVYSPLDAGALGVCVRAWGLCGA